MCMDDLLTVIDTDLTFSSFKPFKVWKVKHVQHYVFTDCSKTNNLQTV